MSNQLQLKRKSAGFTQAKLAKLAGITERGYRSYEASEKTNRRSKPDVVTAIRIANALGIKGFNEFCELWGDNTEKEQFYDC